MGVSEPPCCFYVHRPVITSALNTPTPSLFWEPPAFLFQIQSVDEIIANLGMEQLCPREDLKRKTKENPGGWLSKSEKLRIKLQYKQMDEKKYSM